MVSCFEQLDPGSQDPWNPSCFWKVSTGGDPYIQLVSSVSRGVQVGTDPRGLLFRARGNQQDCKALTSKCSGVLLSWNLWACFTNIRYSTLLGKAACWTLQKSLQLDSSLSNMRIMVSACPHSFQEKICAGPLGASKRTIHGFLFEDHCSDTDCPFLLMITASYNLRMLYMYIHTSCRGCTRTNWPQWVIYVGTRLGSTVRFKNIVIWCDVFCC